MDALPSQEEINKNKYIRYFAIIFTVSVATAGIYSWFYGRIIDNKNSEMDSLKGQLSSLERRLSEEKSKKDEQKENLKIHIGILQAQIATQANTNDDFDKKITAIEKDKTACNDKLETFLKERDLLKERLSLQSAKAKELEEKLHKSKEIQNPKVQKKDNDQDNRKLDYYFKDEQRNK